MVCVCVSVCLSVSLSVCHSVSLSVAHAQLTCQSNWFCTIKNTKKLTWSSYKSDCVSQSTQANHIKSTKLQSQGHGQFPRYSQVVATDFPHFFTGATQQGPTVVARVKDPWPSAALGFPWVCLKSERTTPNSMVQHHPHQSCHVEHKPYTPCSDTRMVKVEPFRRFSFRVPNLATSGRTPFSRGQQDGHPPSLGQ